MALLDSCKFKAQAQGFTLIELLIVVSIIITITAFTMPVFINLGQKRDLSGYQRQIQATIEEARDKTIHENQAYGVYFTASSFTFFEGEEFQGSANQLQTNLPQNLTIAPIQLPNSQMVFLPIDGQVKDYDQNNDQITVSNSVGEATTLTINRLGVINSE